MTIKALSYPTSRPTLDLNFAQTKRLDPRVTFSRSSAGTNFNANGVLQSAATNTARFDHSPVTGESLGLLVEEARTNLIQGSIHHINTYWTAINVNAVPNSSLNLDGTITAATITTTSTNSQHVYHTTTQVSQSSCAFSLLIKAGTARYVALSDGPNTAFSYTVYDLQLGTVVSSGGINTPAGFISSLGNGWFRITQTGGRNNQWLFILNNSLAVTHSESGLSVIVGGVQVETGSFPTSYIPTPATFTGRASTATFYNSSGIIQTAAAGVARSAAFFPDSNGVMRPAGLLLEAAATNLTPRSQEFTSGWTSSPPFNTVTGNVTTAPDGTVTADLINETANFNQFYANRGDVSVVAGTTYTFSVFLKKGSGATAPDWIGLGFNLAGFTQQNVTASFNLSTGALGQKQANVISYGIDKLPNGWYRCHITATSDQTTSGSSGVILFTNNQNVGGYPFYQGQTTSNVHAWGAQVEASPYPTSYIPTTTATVTRSADTSTSATVTRSADVAQITGTNFSSWYNQNEGTAFVQTRNINSFDYSQAPFIGFDGNASLWDNVAEWGLCYNASSVTFESRVYPGGTGFTFGGDTRLSAKSAVAINSTSLALSVNGSVQSAARSSSVMPAITSLRWDTPSGPRQSTCFSRFTYWPTRLSDATLQSITR